MDGEGHKRPGKLHFPVDFNGEIFTEVILFTEVTFFHRLFSLLLLNTTR